MIAAINAKKFLKFLKCLALPLVVGAVSGLLTRDSTSYYQTLILPKFAPPSYLFGIVWTILYIMMGISLYLVYPISGECRRYFGALLVFLFLWPIIFFIFNYIGFSVVWIIITLVIALQTAICFYNENKKAGYLLIPLVLWIAFATVLNIAIYFLN